MCIHHPHLLVAQCNQTAFCTNINKEASTFDRLPTNHWIRLLKNHTFLDANMREREGGREGGGGRERDDLEF